MNKLETLQMLAVLQTAYPQFYSKKTEAELNDAVNLYMIMFEDEPGDLVAMAVKALIKTRESTFPPGIGEINAKIQQITQPKEMTEMEAWALVRKAINGASVSQSSRLFRNGVLDPRTSAERNFEELPEMLQRLVGSPHQLAEWAMMDTDTVNSVVASNFQRSYKVRAKNEREYLALPSSVRQYMDAIADGFDMDKKLLNAPH